MSPGELEARIRTFTSLPIDQIDSAALRTRLGDIGWIPPPAGA